MERAPIYKVSILPRLATGIGISDEHSVSYKFLFFPVLRRGSVILYLFLRQLGFYSSPSCDGDRLTDQQKLIHMVSILPRLATGILWCPESAFGSRFLFFPVLRRGS